ncbi:MAG TPA: amidase [Anaerolineae bacterium]|nr:amidase [Anaerolineae bacterium]
MDNGYDLKRIEAPRLQGASLRGVARLMRWPGTRQLVLRTLYRRAQLTAWRRRVVPEEPVANPVDFFGVGDGAASKIEVDALAEVVRAGGWPSGVLAFNKAYEAGELTPTEVVARLLEVCERADIKGLNIFIAQDRADVLAQAAASTERWAAGRPLSVFDGVPVAIKDEVEQLSYRTTVGTSFLGKREGTSEATVVARLRGAGAILIGKTNMHEIGISPTGMNIHYGAVRNPYGPTHDAGGSSGGSAAAVAAGLCPVAVGADGGGSVRIPAALCGQVGLKATFGRISEFGAVPICWSVAHLGPIGQTVADVALAYGVMAGPDERDPHSWYQPAAHLEGWNKGDLEGMVVGIYRPWFHDAETEIWQTCEEMVGKLEAAGAVVRDVEVPGLETMRLAHLVTILSEMAAHMEMYRGKWPLLADGVEISLRLGSSLTAGDYLHAQRVRSVALQTFNRVFEQVNVLLTPTTGILAPRLAEGVDDWLDITQSLDLMRFVVAANLTGLPAVTVPVGYGENGLPIGMQVMGRPWAEHTLLRVAGVMERAAERREGVVVGDVLGRRPR